jgi:hypothetical protein
MNPPRSPTNLTTSRNRALDIGTDRGGFPDDLPYDVKAGAPTAAAGGAYRQNVERAGSAFTPGAPAAPDPKPFK